MENKYIERPKKFDKKEYDKQYRKNNYVRFAADIKPELMQRINEYCASYDLVSKSDFLSLAISTLEALEK